MGEWYKNADVYSAEEQADFAMPARIESNETSAEKSGNYADDALNRVGQAVFKGVRPHEIKDGEIVKSPLQTVQKTGGQLRSWQPGQSGNPKGRPRKEVEEEVQEAINRGASGARIEASLNRLWELAEQYGSWKAHEAYLKLALPYQLGNPNQRIIHQDDAFNQILEAMRAKRQGE